MLRLLGLSVCSPEGLPRMLSAFADPLRLRILNVLAAKERVSDCHLFELFGALGLPRQNLRCGLSHLRDGQLVAEEREGAWLYYRLAKPAQDLHRGLVGCFGARLAEAETFRADRERLLSLSSCTVRLEAAGRPKSQPAEPDSRTA